MRERGGERRERGGESCVSLSSVTVSSAWRALSLVQRASTHTQGAHTHTHTHRQTERSAAVPKGGGREGRQRQRERQRETDRYRERRMEEKERGGVTPLVFVTHKACGREELRMAPTVCVCVYPQQCLFLYRQFTHTPSLFSLCRTSNTPTRTYPSQHRTINTHTHTHTCTYPTQHRTINPHPNNYPTPPTNHH